MRHGQQLAEFSGVDAVNGGPARLYTRLRRGMRRSPESLGFRGPRALYRAVALSTPFAMR
jgi:hypothetical protein